MYLTALNGHVASESRSDRLGESLRTVDDEKARQGGIEAALDEIIDQRLHGRCVFRGALDQPKRMFVAVRMNAYRRHQGHVRRLGGLSRCIFLVAAGISQQGMGG